MGFAGSQRLVTDDGLDAYQLPSIPEEIQRVKAEHSKIVSERKRLESTLPTVFSTLGYRLAAVLPYVPVEQGNEPPFAAFFERQCPLLKVVTGLCQGADAVAGKIMLDSQDRIKPKPDSGSQCSPDTKCLEAELTAVIPFAWKAIDAAIRLCKIFWKHTFENSSLLG
jgi:hypothetical protein